MDYRLPLDSLQLFFKFSNFQCPDWIENFPACESVICFKIKTPNCLILAGNFRKFC